MRILKSKINKDTNEKFIAISNGIDFDKRIFHEEILVQKAWIRELRKIRVLGKNEHEKIDRALNKAEGLHERGAFPWDLHDEDIHMNLERFLTDNCGDGAKKIHLGRSRNDLIATTLRLFVKNEILAIEEKLALLILSTINRAKAFADHIIPGFTHMQAAQPLRLGQVFLSYGFSIERDRMRFIGVGRSAMEYMPLGSGAMNGTHLSLDLYDLAKGLGFESPSLCSYDAVGDRDFLQEFAHASAILATHLSRMCNDVIFLSSTPVSALVLSGKWSSGSSIMPNKRNPDLFEIVRAKSARLISAANELSVILHGIPSGYSSDLHEAKKVLARISDEIHLCLDTMPDALKTLNVDSRRTNELLHQGHILATDIANSAVSSGKSFRDSYRETAALIEKAQKAGCQVHEISGQHGFLSAVESRDNIGGTSLKQLRKSIKILQDKVEARNRKKRI